MRIITGILLAALALPAVAQRADVSDAALPERAGALRVPDPLLTFQRREAYKVNGRNWVRYRYSVRNRASFPAELFAPAPRLPACGRNANASRTWVDFYDQGGRRLYGFCALRHPDQLGSLWFSLEAGTRPPGRVYIEMKDRQTGRTYRSNLAGTSR